jgi:uncharacterized membrane protein YfcA
MTPLLIFIGITPAVAVASVASHIAASSFSGAISYWRRRAIDPALASVLLIGGTAGTALGVVTFTYLRSLGQLDLMIALSYVVLLTTVGTAMLYEGVRAIQRTRRGALPPRRAHIWIHALPFKMRFKRSKIYLSVIPVVLIGVVIGFIGAIMGIGGGFILVPVLIYLLRVPTSTVIGTAHALPRLACDPVRRAACARRTFNRLGLQSPRHGDAELCRRGAGAVRLDREGRIDSGRPRQL